MQSTRFIDQYEVKASLLNDVFLLEVFEPNSMLKYTRVLQKDDFYHLENDLSGFPKRYQYETLMHKYNKRKICKVNDNIV